MPQCQIRVKSRAATGVLPISTHFTATLDSLSSPASSPPAYLRIDRSLCFHRRRTTAPCMVNRITLATYCRGCWRDSRGFLTGATVIIFPATELYDRTFIVHGVAASGFSYDVQYSPLLPPVGVWTSFQCGRSPLRSAADRRLGGQLSHKLIIRRVHLYRLADICGDLANIYYNVLVSFSVCYPCIGQVAHVTHPSICLVCSELNILVLVFNTEQTSRSTCMC